MLSSIVIIRLSALGDVCQALPAIRAIQNRFPEVDIHWIIGKTEYGLVSDIPGINFIVFDKKQGLKAFSQVRKSLSGQRHDVLLHMQTSLRANALSLAVSAQRRIGFDKDRSRELHSWVVNERINAIPRQHQVDAYFGFARKLGITDAKARWDIPIPEQAHTNVAKQIDSNQPLLLLNACSSPSKRVHRSWPPEFYAVVADYAAQKLDYRVVLIGSPSALEQQAGAEIAARTKVAPLNLIGKTSLKELLALFQRSRLLITSDSGPAHMATAVGTPVMALHAATNPAQTGPYLNREWVISRYADAIKAEYGKPPEELPWGIRAHGEDVMRLIKPDDVILRLEDFTIAAASSARSTSPSIA